MTDQHQPQPPMHNGPPYPPQPQYIYPTGIAASAAPQLAPSKHRKRRSGLVVGAVTAIAALLAGIGIGAASSETTTGTVSAGTSQVVPQACLDALDAAERLIHRGVVPAFDVVVDILDAVSVFDVAGIEAGTADIERLTNRTERLVGDYNAAADQCRSAA